MLIKICTNLLRRKVPRNALKTLQYFSTEASSIITKEIGNKSLILLNKPDILNAMTAKSLAELVSALKDQEKKSIVIVKSVTSKAFSAGGNLKKLAEAGKNKDIEYLEDLVMILNAGIYLVYRYSTPLVCILDGVTMGGAVGISYFAKYKIATENSIFAMPEVKSAFHPNSAASYFFNQCEGSLGYYLALTGASLKGSDIYRAGFASHYCKRDNLKKLEDELINCEDNGNYKDIINDICEKDVPELSLNPVIPKINKCFSKPTVEEIMSKLEEDGSNWALETLDILKKYSPSCLKVTLKQLQRGKNMSLLDIFFMESNISVNIYSFPDVIEGTRILLTDKNDTPAWSPSKLEDVTEELVEQHFKPVNEKKQWKYLAEFAGLRQ